MNEAAKKRLVGAVVLVLLMVIFVPMLFEEAPEPEGPDTSRGLGPTDTEPPPGPVEVFPPASVAGPDDQSLGPDEMLPLEMIEPEPSTSEPIARSPEGRIAEEDAEPPRVSATPPTGRQAERAEAPSRSAASEPEPTGPSVERAPPSAGDARYVVQVAALSTAERAAGLEAELRDKGFSSFTERAVVGGRTYFRVRVGPEHNRQRAARLAEAVQQATGYQAQVLTQR